MKIRGILFDYNGVLAGDEDLQEKAMANVMARYGCDVTPSMFEQLCLGRSDREGFKRLQNAFPDMQPTQVGDLINEKVDEYQQLVRNKSIVYYGVHQMLEAVSDQYRIGLVTGSLRVEVQPVLKQENILRYFDAIVTADDVKHSKPHPEPYTRGAEGLGITPQEGVVIEDTPAGIRSAKSAGLFCVAVTHTLPENMLREADHIIHRITDLDPEYFHNV